MSRETETQRHGDEFVERNAWLHLLLGLERWGQRFDGLLDAYAPPDTPRHSPAPDDERFVDFVLGIAAMRASLRRALAAAMASPRAPSAERPSVPASTGGWLR